MMSISSGCRRTGSAKTGAFDINTPVLSGCERLQRDRGKGAARALQLSAPAVECGAVPEGLDSHSAMILEEPLRCQYSLLGTDFDTGALTQAEEGLYSDNLLNSLPAKYREKYFTQEGRMWRLTETIRDRVRFRRHNLLEDPFDTGFHLILCRNVFIYFTPEAQARLTKQFSDSLVSGGYFVVGNAENLLEPEMADLKRVSYCIYQRA